MICVSHPYYIKHICFDGCKLLLHLNLESLDVIFHCFGHVMNGFFWG